MKTMRIKMTKDVPNPAMYSGVLDDAQYDTEYVFELPRPVFYPRGLNHVYITNGIQSNILSPSEIIIEIKSDNVFALRVNRNHTKLYIYILVEMNWTLCNYFIKELHELRLNTN